jgi:hypothetical protein
MHRLAYGLVPTALIPATVALAQSVALPADVETTGSFPITFSASKQKEIKASIAGSERGLRVGAQLPRLQEELALGMTVPWTVDLIALPQDAITEIPTTSSYRFVLTGDRIAVVDPSTRTVVQIIK